MIIRTPNLSFNTQLIIVSGPTASGKTDLAIELALHFNTDIISFDSRQFYSELNIGTAKPSKEQLNQVKHHFIGNKSIHEDYNAELFSQESRKLIDQLSPSKQYLVLVGGSGLYLDALLYSFDPMPEVDKSIRAQLNQIRDLEGLKPLQVMLLEKDPEYYNSVDLNNPQRIIRALEVCLTTKKPFSSFRKAKKTPIPYKTQKICIGPPMDQLYRKIEDRVDSMILEGLREEAFHFFSYRNLNPLKTVGYVELFEYFENKISLEESISKIKQHTRNFAKRQLTWFRRDAENTWFESNHKEKIISLLEKKGLS